MKKEPFFPLPPSPVASPPFVDPPPSGPGRNASRFLIFDEVVKNSNLLCFGRVWLGAGDATREDEGTPVSLAPTPKLCRANAAAAAA